MAEPTTPAPATAEPGGHDRASDRVHGPLRSRILSGAVAPGDKLPSERVLAAEHGVNRHAVREALKRLEQAGLIVITQGGPTRVRDWRRTGGLELLLDLIAPAGEQTPPELARGVLEMRAGIGVDAARLCALRADRATREAVLPLAEEAAEAAGGSDLERSAVAYAVLWDHVVRGADNLAYELSLNSLVLALASHEDLLVRTLPTAADAPVILALARAVAGGDPAGAADRARDLLEDDAQQS